MHKLHTCITHEQIVITLSFFFFCRIEDKEDSQPVTMTTDTAGETTDSDPPIIDKGQGIKQLSAFEILWVTDLTIELPHRKFL